MEELLSKEGLRYIIERVISHADDALKEKAENPDNLFVRGKLLAYYEMLDTIKNELDIREQDLKSFGLDIDIEKIY